MCSPITVEISEQVFTLYIKTSLFISLCILRDVPQQQISTELCSGGVDLATFLCSHGGPMERFLDRRDQENSKTQGGKEQIRNFFFKQGKNGRKKKKRCVLHWLGLPFCDPPLRRTTRMGISPTTYFY